jgi:stearoyl-CoA desaturase (delta-9 desaturase)
MLNAAAKSGTGTEARYAGFMVLAPLFGTLAAILLLAYRGNLAPPTIWLFVGFYLLGAVGIEVGFHRYFSHRSFKCLPWVRAMLGACGSIAGQGPVLYWVALHRLHHRFSDTEQDPHTPQPGTLSALYRAHIGWLFETRTLDFASTLPDLVRDPTTVRVHKQYLRWFVAGLAAPTLIGGALAGWIGALEGLLWGGWARMFLNHHVTWSINSLCHRFGHRSFETRDGSRNIAWLSLLSVGGSWHNNHHAFQASATNDHYWWQIDPGAWIIRIGAKLGLMWDVRDRGHMAQRR